MKGKIKIKDFLNLVMIITKNLKNMQWLFFVITNVLNVKNLILVEQKIVNVHWYIILI